MSHSYYKIWLHVVFSTKNRNAFIHPKIERQVFDYLSAELNELGCVTRIVNGMPDHVHLLFLQNPNKTVPEIVKQIKGSSSHWINLENLTEDKFSWQTGFSVFSVSESQLEKVFNYIHNQKAHHGKKSAEKELESLLKLHNIAHGFKS